MPADSTRVSSTIPELLTPDEAVRVLKLSKASLYRLVEKRLLPFYRVSGSLRFGVKDLENYLTSRRVESVGQERK
ncbi:MAG: helix-turn-helix domain-containing protein [Ignavibacteriae bacterium]|nr:helix-turn-helix domain-containing protein [Ignavibacteriota bacterium]